MARKTSHATSEFYYTPDIILILLIDRQHFKDNNNNIANNADNVLPSVVKNIVAVYIAISEKTKLCTEGVVCTQSSDKNGHSLQRLVQPNGIHYSQWLI